jgi:hypothetical protein
MRPGVIIVRGDVQGVDRSLHDPVEELVPYMGMVLVSGGIINGHVASLKRSARGRGYTPMGS